MAKHNKKKVIYIVLAGVIVLFVPIGLMLLPGKTQEPLEDRVVIPSSNEEAEQSEEEILEVELLCIELRSSEGVRKAVGTGVVYDVTEEGIWIATAAHVLEKKEKGDEIRILVGEKLFSCTKFYPAKDADLTFVYLANSDMEDDKQLVFKEINTNKTTYDALTAEESVTAKGYQAGEAVEYWGTLLESWIYVEDFQQYMMLARCEVHQGMSGGGLYDSEGNFIGMICGGNEDGELVAVPWHVMLARYEEL